MRRTPRRSPLDGFTLVELLIVVATMALLAGLLIPAVSLVQESSRKTRCSRGLNQMYLACLAYSQDNDGLLPNWTSGSDTMAHKIASYLYPEAANAAAYTISYNSQIACPTARILHPNPTGTSFASMAMNFNVGDVNKNVNIATVNHGSQYMAFADAGWRGSTNGWMMLSNWNYDGGSTPDDSENNYSFPSSPHKGSTNLLFWDGHGENRPRNQIPYSWTGNNSPSLTEKIRFWQGK